MRILSGRIDADFVGTEKSASVNRTNESSQGINFDHTNFLIPHSTSNQNRSCPIFSARTDRTFDGDQREPPISVSLLANFPALSMSSEFKGEIIIICELSERHRVNCARFSLHYILLLLEMNWTESRSPWRGGPSWAESGH